MTDDPTTKSAVFWAVISLLAFCAITLVSLVAWFATQRDPWTFGAVIALASLGLGLTNGGLLLRSPSPVNVLAGMSAMVFSLVRLGSPGAWTAYTMFVVVITLLLSLPLVRAALVLARSS